MALPRLLLTAVLIVVLLVLASLAPAPADVVNRPDLKVTKGSVALSPGGERIKGRFTVRNAGSLPARSSTSYVQAKVSGNWRYVTELRILALAPGKNAKYDFDAAARRFLRQGSHPVRVCLDVKKKVDEAREGNNCFSLGKVALTHGPFGYQVGQKFLHRIDGGAYWGWVPAGYDATGSTPSALFVWLHGCGGQNEFDIETYAPDPTDSYVMVAPAGAEGGCWSPPGSGADEAIVTRTIADAVTHFAIDPQRIVLGGYSSGGDLSYRYAYHHSAAIEAVLVANSAPFKDTGLTQEQALAAADTKFRVVHLAHLRDRVYPIETVRSELLALSGNGFAVTKIERDGFHYDGSTDAHIRADLLSQVDP